MIAKNIMVTTVLSVQADELVKDVLVKMRKARFRMLPVLDHQKHIAGVISTSCIMRHSIPEYVANGDLKELSYAPDIGIMHGHYSRIANQPISQIMHKAPLIVNYDDSLLSVAAALSTYGKHEYAMVVNAEKQLIGIVSAGDILDTLQEKKSEMNNA